MVRVRPYPIPVGTVLGEQAQRPGYYTDCFATEVDAQVPFSGFIEAFYTTPLFKTERIILRAFAGIRSTDEQARQLGLGDVDRFAAWTAAFRTDTQLYMDTGGRTASWFMIETVASQTAPTTRLLFGSVVEPMTASDGSTPRMGFLFASALGAHRIYSRLLLAAAARRVVQAVKRASDKVVT